MASPEIAGQHDKARWLALYSDDAIVEDPVGTPASHRGRRQGRFGDELGRFYEAFIAPSGIEMHARKDIVSDMHVFRAVDIHTTNLKTGLEMTVPANLLYQLVPRESELAIERMQAHWEANRMGRLLMGQGLLGTRTIAVMNWSMVRAFGIRWLLRYVKATQAGVGRQGRELVAQLASQIGATQVTHFSEGAAVELPGSLRTSAEDFAEACTALTVRDLLASGSTVSGLAKVEWGGREREAGFVAELDSQASKVRRLRLFWEH
jgi:hypothetical protein